MKFLLRRMLRAVLLLVEVSALCFLFTEIAPGSFFDEMRSNPQISPETIDALRSRYGLKQTLPVRYARWFAAVLHGDLGHSIAYNLPVGPLLLSHAKNTLLLTTTATVLTWMIGLPLGVCASSFHKRWLDKIIGTGTSLLISIPEIVIAIVLLVAAIRWRLAPTGGMMSLDFEALSAWGRFHDIALRLLLPVSILVLASLATVVRHVRTSFLEVQNAPCIQAARGYGIPRFRLVYRHILPLAANPASRYLDFLSQACSVAHF